MKFHKMFLVAAITMAPGLALSSNYGSAGCGLGSLIFEPGEGFTQVFAATSNASFYSQTFGITTGTSNCNSEAAKSASLDQKAFIHHNYASLVRDVARGDGEYLSAFATLLGCSEGVRSNFFDYAQSQDELFQADAKPLEVLENVKSDLAKDAVLNAQCSRI